MFYENEDLPKNPNSENQIDQHQISPKQKKDFQVIQDNNAQATFSAGDGCSFWNIEKTPTNASATLISPEEILPPPKVNPKKSVSGIRRRGKTAVITSSLYLAKLTKT